MSIDGKIQKFFKRNLTLEDAFPTKMPTYVNSFGYFFGTMTLSALAMLFFTGVCMSLFGPVWRHTSSIGAFVNAMHYWSVEVFYLSLVMHVMFKFFTAAWRDGRWRTWLTGWCIFAASIFSGITGTLLQQNWDSQWNTQQGKDAFAALGLGWLNWNDYASLLTMHVVFFAVIVAALALVHLFLVRREGPVHPIAKGAGEPVAEEADER
jgi:ubiquinol-cytochrome c reductase cytochrome b subunit